MKKQRIDFHGKLDSRTTLGDGSVRFNARLTRTGVFDYGDHKELRRPEDVFAKEAIDSFKGVAVTVGHRAFVEPENWSDVAVGHVGDDVHQDGDFLAASLVVKDADALKWIDDEQRASGGVELSMGYTVDLDETPGRTDAGEEYDAIQTNIVGNHAALGPSNWGRAGREVRLLDGAAYAPPEMATQKIDAPANTKEDTDQVRKDLDAARADNEAIRKERDDARNRADAEKKRADTAEAERDAAKADTAKEKARADKAEASVDEKVTARIVLLDSARVVLGATYDAKGKSDRDVRIAALTKLDAKFDATGKSDDYVDARFDLAIESAKTAAGALAQVNAVTAPTQVNADGTGAGDTTKSVLDEALEAKAKRDEEAAKGGAPKGALTKK